MDSIKNGPQKPTSVGLCRGCSGPMNAVHTEWDNKSNNGSEIHYLSVWMFSEIWYCAHRWADMIKPKQPTYKQRFLSRAKLKRRKFFFQGHTLATLKAHRKIIRYVHTHLDLGSSWSELRAPDLVNPLKHPCNHLLLLKKAILLFIFCLSVFSNHTVYSVYFCMESAAQTFSCE